MKRIERKFRLFVRKYLIKGKVFYWLVLILVLLNTVSMSLTRYNQPVQMKKTLGELNMGFSFFFVAKVEEPWFNNIREMIRVYYCCPKNL